MNIFLTDDIRKRIRGGMLRFDNPDMEGKVVAASVYGDNLAGVSFTDGTWAAVRADRDYEGVYVDHVDRMPIEVLARLLLITETEYVAATARERDATLQRQITEIKRLQKEVDARQEP